MTDYRQYEKLLKSNFLTCFDCYHFRALGCDPDEKDQHKTCKSFNLFNKNKFFTSKGEDK